MKRLMCFVVVMVGMFAGVARAIFPAPSGTCWLPCTTALAVQAGRSRRIGMALQVLNARGTGLRAIQDLPT